jgi:hypothetical protein
VKTRRLRNVTPTEVLPKLCSQFDKAIDYIMDGFFNTFKSPILFSISEIAAILLIFSDASGNRLTKSDLSFALCGNWAELLSHSSTGCY